MPQLLKHHCATSVSALVTEPESHIRSGRAAIGKKSECVLKYIGHILPASLPANNLSSRTVSQILKSIRRQTCRRMWSTKVSNPVQQHARRAAVVFVVVENALPDGRIGGLDPAVKPFDRCRTGRVRIAPCKTEILR